MTEYVTKTFDVDGLVYIEGVNFTIELETETYPAEPYSWGGSRGSETEITSMEIVGVQVGGLTLTEEQATKMFGEDAIRRVYEGLLFD